MKEIKVFSTPTCPYCVTLKEFLKSNEIEFEDIDVSIDFEAQKEMVEATNQLGVPVVKIDQQWVVGFDREKIAKLLGLKK